jgi:hypothetical protein
MQELKDYRRRVRMSRGSAQWMEVGSGLRGMVLFCGGSVWYNVYHVARMQIGNMQIGNVQHATCNMQRATCNMCRAAVARAAVCAALAHARRICEHAQQRLQQAHVQHAA